MAGRGEVGILPWSHRDVPVARGEAKRQLARHHDEIDAEMAEVVRTFNDVEIRGIVQNGSKTPLDESRTCYKDLDEVLKVLTDEDIARIERRLYPVANIKGVG